MTTSEDSEVSFIVKNPRIVARDFSGIFLLRFLITELLEAALATSSMGWLIRAAAASRRLSCEAELQFSIPLDNRISAVISRTEISGDVQFSASSKSQFD